MRISLRKFESFAAKQWLNNTFADVMNPYCINNQ